MPTDTLQPSGPADDAPIVEVVLDVGESVRIGGHVLQVLDTEGEDAMLRVERLHYDDDTFGDTQWSELPR